MTLSRINDGFSWLDLINTWAIKRIKREIKRIHLIIDLCLTSIICKVLESVIRDHIITHFVRNDMFSKQQYGFLKGRNTVIQLIKMFDQWSDSLEVGGQVQKIKR